MTEEVDGRTPRDAILALFERRHAGRLPCFSGLISVTVPGLEHVGLRLSEVHTDASKMAVAAASTARLFGFGSAVVPLDMCVEAGVLGAEVDFRIGAPRPELPKVVAPLAESSADLNLSISADLTHRERISVVIEAIGMLRRDVGREVAIGAWVPGPFTLALQLVNTGNLIREVARQVPSLGELLDPLTEVLVQVARAYRSAGADYLTVHEMGGSPGFIGRPAFEDIVLPRLQRLLAELPAPRVLSICGNTNRSMQVLSAAGADALSVDQTNDLVQSRETLGPEALLFGNIDPVATLANGDEADVRQAVKRAIDAGVDAVWPACDLWPAVPAENVQAMVDETRRYRQVESVNEGS